MRGVWPGPTVFVANEHLKETIFSLPVQFWCKKYYRKSVKTADLGRHCLFRKKVPFRHKWVWFTEILLYVLEDTISLISHVDLLYSTLKRSTVKIKANRCCFFKHGKQRSIDTILMFSTQACISVDQKLCIDCLQVNTKIMHLSFVDHNDWSSSLFTKAFAW